MAKPVRKVCCLVLSLFGLQVLLIEDALERRGCCFFVMPKNSLVLDNESTRFCLTSLMLALTGHARPRSQVPTRPKIISANRENATPDASK